MVPRETVSFVFPRVLMFLTTKSRETSGLDVLEEKAFFTIETAVWSAGEIRKVDSEAIQ